MMVNVRAEIMAKITFILKNRKTEISEKCRNLNIFV